MNEKHVCSLELAKELKENGYPQEGEFWWSPQPGLNSDLLYNFQLKMIKATDTKGSWNNYFVAPLASELLEELSFKVKSGERTFYLCIFKTEKGYAVEYTNYTQVLIAVEDNKFVNVLSEVWLYLKKHDLLK